MTYELFREVNTVLPLIAFGWLTYRTRAAWPADWAKPHYLWHYRSILLIVLSFVALTSFGSIVHEAMHTKATYVSVFYTVQSAAVLVVCYCWPPFHRRRWRRVPCTGDCLS